MIPTLDAKFGPMRHATLRTVWVAESNLRGRQDLDLWIPYIFGKKNWKKRKPAGAILLEFWLHFWAKSGKYRVFTVAAWLRKHPHCDVGHQLMPLIDVLRNMLCQEVHSPLSKHCRKSLIYKALKNTV
jgi:hypothetical protein